MKTTLPVIGLFSLFASLSSAAVLTENFDDITTLAGSGWAVANESTPLGTTDWFQGNGGIFPSQSGAADSYIAANYLNADPLGGDVSNWLMTPELTLSNGLTLTFYSRTELNPADFADRLEVRLSTAGSSTSTSDFLELLLTINPTLTSTGYPADWTQYSVTLTGLGGPATGRFGFHYDVPDTTVNGDYIGIDTLSIDGASVPEPATWAMVAGGLALAGFMRRKQ